MNLAQEGNNLLTRLPTAVSAILAILLGSSAAQLSWQLYPVTESPQAGVIPTASNQQPSRAPSNPALAITPHHLFGKSGPANNTSQRTSTQEAPETRLNLTLRGVLAFDDPDLAMAIISQNGRDEQIFAVGETLPGNAKLKEVYADRIILERGGRLETLKLPEERGADIEFSQPATTTPGPAAASTILQQAQSAKDLRDSIVANPKVLSDMVSTVPVRRGGKLIGYRLKPKQDTGTLEQYGLMPQDVITKVNGVPLDSPRKGLKVLRDLVKAKNIDLTVERSGSEVPLSISLE